MIDPVEFAGAAVWVALIGAFVAHNVWAHRARQRRLAGACSRCGKSPLELAERDEQQGRSMCSECQRKTQRNYRFGSWFFYGVAALFAFVAVLIVISALRQPQIRATPLDAVFILGIIGLPAAMGWAISYFGRRVR